MQRGVYALLLRPYIYARVCAAVLFCVRVLVAGAWMSMVCGREGMRACVLVHSPSCPQLTS